MDVDDTHTAKILIQNLLIIAIWWVVMYCTVVDQEEHSMPILVRPGFDSGIRGSMQFKGTEEEAIPI